MATPTIFSNVATNPLVAKVDRSGAMEMQRAVAIVPASTIATTIIGMIRFQQNFNLYSFQLKSDDLDTATTVTLNVGYVYDSVSSGSDSPAAFLSAVTIAQTGTSVIWPIATGLLTASGFQAAGPGYLVVQIQAGPTTTLGNLTLVANYAYDA